MERTDDEPEQGWTVTRHRVIYGDTDAMGVVYYGNYMRFFEIGRNECFRARGGTYRAMESGGFLMPVIEVGTTYRRPARYDDELEIATRGETVGACRVRFTYRLVRAADRELLTEGFTVHACVSSATGRVLRLPPELVELFA